MNANFDHLHRITINQQVTTRDPSTVNTKSNTKPYIPTLTSQIAAKYLMNKCGFFAALVQTKMHQYHCGLYILPRVFLPELSIITE